MKNFIMVLLITAPFFSFAQLRIAGGLGIGRDKQIGAIAQANVGYEIKHFGGQVDMVTFTSTKSPAWFGANVGAIKRWKDNAIRLFAGYYWKDVGNKNSQDRYISNGVEKILYSNLEVNGWNPSAGIQFYHHFLFIDARYLKGLKLSVGLTYSFRKE